MIKEWKHIKYILVITIFIVFNFILLYNLRYEKIPQGQIKPKIVLISHVYTNPYWQYIRLGAEKAAEERNAIIDFQGPDTASVEEGIKFINIANAARVSGIIAYVQDEDRYTPVINKVIEDGIPIVTVDCDAPKSERLAYVGTDNLQAGRMGAVEMINQVGREGSIAIIMGGSNAKNQIERVNGFDEYIKKNSNIIIKDVESSDSLLLRAELAAKDILTKDSDIKALFCTSALDGQGAAKTVNNLDLTGKVKIICFDDLPETLDGIRNGTISATIVQRPYIMGYKSVNVIMDKLEGKESSREYLTDVLVVKKENIDKYVEEQGDNSSEIK